MTVYFIYSIKLHNVLVRYWCWWRVKLPTKTTNWAIIIIITIIIITIIIIAAYSQ